jgi:hypothetical protein
VTHSGTVTHTGSLKYTGVQASGFLELDANGNVVSNQSAYSHYYSGNTARVNVVNNPHFQGGGNRKSGATELAGSLRGRWLAVASSPLLAGWLAGLPH